METPVKTKQEEVATMSLAEVQGKLQLAAALIASPNPFCVGDVVTARNGFGYSGIGTPHVVVSTIRLRRNRNGFGTPQYGKIADLLVVTQAPDGTILQFWVESHGYEVWTEEHGAAYAERVAKVQAAIEAKYGPLVEPLADAVATLDNEPSQPITWDNDRPQNNDNNK